MHTVYDQLALPLKFKDVQGGRCEVESVLGIVKC